MKLLILPLCLLVASVALGGQEDHPTYLGRGTTGTTRDGLEWRPKVQEIGSSADLPDWKEQYTIIVKKTMKQAAQEVSKKEAVTALGIAYPPPKTLASFDHIQKEVKDKLNVEIKSIYNIEKIRNGIENSNPMWKIGDRIKVTSQINRIHEGKIYAITPTSIRIGDDIIYDVDFTDEISVHVNRNKWNTFITKLVAKKEQEFSPSIYKIEQSLYDQAGNKYKMTKFQGAWYTDDGIEKLANKKWASLIQERVIKLQRIEFSAIGFIWYANNWYPKDVAKQMYAEAQERSRCRECGGSGEVWETRIGSRWYQHSGPSNFNASDGGYRDRRAKCKECNGTGHVTFEYCPDCNGKKRIYKTVMYGNRLAQQIMPCPSCNGSGRK